MNLFELIWKYAHCRTATHRRTTGQPHAAAGIPGQPYIAAHTTTHTAALPDAAARSAAHCRTLLHEFECQTAAHRTPHTAYRLPHPPHSRTL
jgi:hypothetical protein